MAVSLIYKNYDTNTCKFAYDNWILDSVYLPNLTSKGKGVLRSVPPISMGSKAIGTNDGITKILNGNNQWVNYSSSGSSSGSNDSDDFIDFDNVASGNPGDGFIDLDGGITGGGSVSGSDNFIDLG